LSFWLNCAHDRRDGWRCQSGIQRIQRLPRAAADLDATIRAERAAVKAEEARLQKEKEAQARADAAELANLETEIRADEVHEAMIQGPVGSSPVYAPPGSDRDREIQSFRAEARARLRRRDVLTGKISQAQADREAADERQRAADEREEERARQQGHAAGQGKGFA
jgi:hypothetical protein